MHRLCFGFCLRLSGGESVLGRVRAVCSPCGSDNARLLKRARVSVDSLEGTLRYLSELNNNLQEKESEMFQRLQHKQNLNGFLNVRDLKITLDKPKPPLTTPNRPSLKKQTKSVRIEVPPSRKPVAYSKSATQ
jgi:hypothetical protein